MKTPWTRKQISEHKYGFYRKGYNYKIVTISGKNLRGLAKKYVALDMIGRPTIELYNLEGDS